MTGTSLLKITTSLDQGTQEQTPQKLEALWNSLTRSEPDGSHVVEKVILRWLLKSITGSSPEVETIRRYPLTWAILGCVFSRIPLFSLAKALADRRFIVILQQALKEVSSPSDSKGVNGDVGGRDAKPAGVTKSSLKRKIFTSVSFDLDALRSLQGCLASADQLFATLGVLLSRISSGDVDQQSPERIGIEHLKALFRSPASEAIGTLSSSLAACELAVKNHDLGAFDSQDSWVRTAATMWDMRLQSSSDALNFSLHLSKSCFVSLWEFLLDSSDIRSSAQCREVSMAWARDLKGLMTKNLILPARLDFLNRKGTEILTTPIRLGSLPVTTLSPVLFHLMLEAPQAVGGISTNKDNKDWIEAVFDIMEAPLRHLSAVDRNAGMHRLLEMAVAYNCSPAQSSLLHVCKEYALGDNGVDWPLVSSLAECDPDIFLVSGDGKQLLEGILNRAPNGSINDKGDYDSLCSLMLSLARASARAREFPRYIQMWFESLLKCSLDATGRITSGIFWLDPRISRSVSILLQEAITTKQLVDLISDLGRPIGASAQAARTVVFDAIFQSVTAEDFVDAAGTAIFEQVWKAPILTVSTHVLAAQWRIAARAFRLGIAEPTRGLGCSVIKHLHRSLQHPNTSDPATFDAFRCAAAAWYSAYIGDGTESELESAIFKFLGSLESELRRGGLSCDNGLDQFWVDRSENPDDADAFRPLQFGSISAAAYVAWIVLDFPTFISMLITSSTDASGFLRAILALVSRDLTIGGSAKHTSIQGIATCLVNSLAGIPGEKLSSSIVSQIIDVLSPHTGIVVSPWEREAAIRLLTKLPSEFMSRSDRERVVASLFAQSRASSGLIDYGVLQQSALGAIVQMMRKPTFYADMGFRDLLELGNSVFSNSPHTTISAKISASATAFKLFGELAHLTLRQMTASYGPREVAYINEIWPMVSDNLPAKRRGRPRLVPVTLLSAFLCCLRQSPACGQLTKEVAWLAEAEGELSRLVTSTFKHFFKAKAGKKREQDTESYLELRAALVACNTYRDSAIDAAVAALWETMVSEASVIRQVDTETGCLLSSFMLNRKLDAQGRPLGHPSQEPSESAVKSGDDPLALDITVVLGNLDKRATDGDEYGKAGLFRELSALLAKDSISPLQYLTVRRAVRELENSIAPEAATGLGLAQSELTQALVTAASVGDFVDAARIICTLMDGKLAQATQWNVEHTLSCVALVSSGGAPCDETLRSSPKVYEWLCLLTEIVLKRHRRRLEGHLHLLVTALQSLLTCLIRNPYDARRVSWAAGRAHGSLDAYPFWERQAKTYARLLTLVCEPSAASVMRLQQSTLDSATDAAKRSAGQHMYLVLMHFIKLQLECDIPHIVREALVPGVYSVLDVTPPELRKVMVDAMDASGRAIWKDLYEKYRKFGKWRGT